MIRIGVGRPRLSAATDRWGQADGRRTTNGYAYVGAEMWGKLLAYQSPPIPLDEVGEALCRPQIEAILALPGKTSLIWEFNALAPDLKGVVRFLAWYGAGVFPEKRRFELVAWSWWDARVALPLLRAWAAVWNAVHGGDHD